MGSSISSGYATERAVNGKKSKCKESKDGKHKWIVHNKRSPSQREECRHCKITVYYK